MKQKYVILRAGGTAATGPFTGPLGTGVRGGLIGGGPFAADPRIEADDLDSNRVAELRQQNDVVAIAPQMPTRLIAPLDVDGTPPEATLGNVTWGVQAVGADGSQLTGEGVTVAVLDTGIDRNHPAFAGVDIVEQDFTGDGNGDVNGHGTHCAGTIFGRDVSGIRIGVARGVQRALIGKVLGNDGSGNTLWSLEAIEWAVKNGATVISMSLGIDFPGYVDRLVNQSGIPTDLATSIALEGFRTTIGVYEGLVSFVKARHEFGGTSIIVAAAGNENRQFQNPDWSIAVGLPAATDGILSVAALGQGDGGYVPARFSNSGAMVAAPGVNVLSAQANSAGLVAFNGTSMAAPHVAGVAALWAQWLRRQRTLTPFTLETKLAGSATTASLDPRYQPADVGLGLVQAPPSA
ncbi:S8 family peptidase [Alienimonas californiensis]|uniref:Intracellular serine protease n=1 Tax=Alienimonas californiensis TaxID=2527989 RepID=A0A517PBK6_9PLAN|nr:S8 family serine peptidase [Alienimonas californiensis]QDT16768.1 Intracellular serine protease [Alienimonas californiensis]